MRPADPRTTTDIMSYADGRSWASRFTYERLFNKVKGGDGKSGGEQHPLFG